MNEEKLMPIHPGEVLLEEFLKPMDLSQEQIASALQIPTEQISKVIHGQQRITAELALRLAYFFKMSPRFWLGLQMDYDLDIAEDEVGEQLKQEITVLKRQ